MLGANLGSLLYGDVSLMFDQCHGNIDLDNSYTFMYSFNLLYHRTSLSQATKISNIFTISHIKAQVAKFDLAVK